MKSSIIHSVIFDIARFFIVYECARLIKFDILPLRSLFEQKIHTIKISEIKGDFLRPISGVVFSNCVFWNTIVERKQITDTNVHLFKSIISVVRLCYNYLHLDPITD